MMQLPQHNDSDKQHVLIQQLLREDLSSIKQINTGIYVNNSNNMSERMIQAIPINLMQLFNKAELNNNQ